LPKPQNDIENDKLIYAAIIELKSCLVEITAFGEIDII